MCGIVGYIGKRNSVPLLIDSLKRLEYRGYDSAGIAFLNSNGIKIYKTRGKVDDLKGIIAGVVQDSSIGLGHTRWATHGAPSAINAHPHASGGVAVVHNGIIENYRELKSRILSSDMAYVSETDTEVIPRMLSSCMNEGLPFLQALRFTSRELRGSYALGIVSDTTPECLYAVKNGSPLVIGIGDGEYFFASDVPAILPYTRKFIFMEDGQICTLRPDGFELTRLDTERPVEGKIIKVDWSPSMAEKEGYKHFMLKEIHEQPRVINDTLSEWIDSPLSLLEEIGLTAGLTLGLRRLQIVACGTSYHAALIGKYLLESLARIPVDVDIASEYRYKRPIIENGHTLFISITQSGETADTLAAQREAKARGARTLTICNVVGSTASREADSVLYTRAGPEIGVASTKAFTAQLSALCLLTIAIGMKHGRLLSREADTLKTRLMKMPSLLEKTLRLEPEIQGLAGNLPDTHTFLYLGRGINYPIALEGALKLKEISYIHAEGHAAGEMKHGPIALVEDSLPVVVVAPVDELYHKTLSNIEEVRARGARVIVVTDERSGLADKADDIIEVPATHPALSAFVNLIPLQLLAYHVAVLRGCDVDQPRNLAKSVTVE
jgi:glucosamine--fructose-6-phosphate aminotransferase (isomerizing)